MTVPMTNKPRAGLVAFTIGASLNDSCVSTPPRKMSCSKPALARFTVMPFAVGLLNGVASSDGQPTIRVAGALVTSTSAIALKSLVAVACPKGRTKPRTLSGVFATRLDRSSVLVATWYEFGLASPPAVGPEFEPGGDQHARSVQPR